MDSSILPKTSGALHFCSQVFSDPLALGCCNQGTPNAATAATPLTARAISDLANDTQKAYVICIWKWWYRGYPGPGLDIIYVWNILKLWTMKNEIDWCFQYLESRVSSSGNISNHSKKKAIEPCQHRMFVITENITLSHYPNYPPVNDGKYTLAGQKLCLLSRPTAKAFPPRILLSTWFWSMSTPEKLFSLLNLKRGDNWPCHTCHAKWTW